jgi:EAL domain-containing protein (putative c-di-GMP-specific phosphodiesterase class I)
LAQGKLMHLLILDDDASIGAILSKIAIGLEWTATHTTNAAEFQAQLAARPPDAVALDLQLGTSDGIEQLRFLRAIGFKNPIIIMSGFEERIIAAAVQRGTSLGLTMVGILRKPMRAAAVREVLAMIRDQHAPVSPERINTALESNAFAIHLQPVIDARTWQVHHLEALLRWPRLGQGWIAPAEFISIAERDPELMSRLTLWVVRTAAEAYGSLKKASLAVPIAVNVSAANLHDLNFPDALTAVLENAGLPTSALLLEVTESVATGDPVAMLDILVRLRLKGFGVSIDDFGTGYSSLLALHRLPFSELKIDRRFVSEILTSREAHTIVRSVVDLAHNLGLRTVAEGVETEAVAEALRTLGIDALQGYYFSKPLPMNQLVTWMRDWGPHAASRQLRAV